MRTKLRILMKQKCRHPDLKLEKEAAPLKPEHINTLHIDRLRHMFTFLGNTHFDNARKKSTAAVHTYMKNSKDNRQILLSFRNFAAKIVIMQKRMRAQITMFKNFNQDILERMDFVISQLT